MARPRKKIIKHIDASYEDMAKALLFGKTEKKDDKETKDTKKKIVKHYKKIDTLSKKMDGEPTPKEEWGDFKNEDP